MYYNGSWGENNYQPDVLDYFKELPFCDKYVPKTKVERLKNIDSPSELPFHEKLNVIKINHTFKRYAMS